MASAGKRTSACGFASSIRCSVDYEDVFQLIDVNLSPSKVWNIFICCWWSGIQRRTLELQTQVFQAQP